MDIINFNNISNNNYFQIPLDTLVVDQENVKEIQCAICLQIVNIPRQCRNGHLYCLGCIEQSLKKSSKCPICRVSIGSVDKLSRSLFLEKHLRNLIVYCKNHFKIEEPLPLVGTLNNNSKQNVVPNWIIDLDGCNFQGTNESIQEHEKVCQFRFEVCKYSNVVNGYCKNNSNSSLIENDLASSVNSNVIVMNCSTLMNNSIHGNSSGSGNSSPLVLIKKSGIGSPSVKSSKRKNSLIVGENNNNNDENVNNNNNSIDGGEDEDSEIDDNDDDDDEDIIIQECGKIRFKDLENHYQTCPFRPTKCNFCNFEFPFHSIKYHENNCDLKLVDCSQCKSLIPKKELKSHLDEKCPNQIIPCTFGYCDKTFERKDLINHLNESLGQHLILMKQQQQDEINQLKKDFNNQITAKDEKIKALEKLIKERLLEPKIKIDWRIRNYFECKKNGYVQSEKFLIEGFPFFIGIFTDGDNNESKGYISIYLFLDTTEIPKGRSINTEFSLKFNNQKDSLQSLNREYKATFPIRDGSGWGDRRSIKTINLESNGFIGKDNTLLITAEITIKKILYFVEETHSDKH